MLNENKQFTYILNDYTSVKNAMRIFGKDVIDVSDKEEEALVNILKKIQGNIQNAIKAGKDSSVYFMGDEFKKYRSNPNLSFKLFKNFGQEKWMNQYVGILYYKDKEGEYFLRLQSRFDANIDEINNEGQEKTKIYEDIQNGYFTRYVLSKAWDTGASIFGEQIFQGGSNEILEQLMAIVFIERIRQAFKKGIFRQYRNFERNDEKVKGRIDTSRHIKLNPIFNGKIAYTSREYTPENDINLLILTTYRMLEKKYPWFKQMAESRRNVKDFIAQMSKIMDPVSELQVSALVKKCNHKITHPIYRDWEEARCVAIAIQRHMGNYNGGNKKSEMAGVLFDMNEAWEIYLQKIFAQYSWESEYNVMPQVEKLSILFPTHGGKAVAEEGKRGIRPDFLFTKKQSNMKMSAYTMVWDAKNKGAWENIIKPNDVIDSDPWKKNEDFPNGAIREDVFEVLTYAYILNCPVSGIICPVRLEVGKARILEEEPYLVSMIGEDNKNFYVIGVPTLPASKSNITDYDYKDYKEAMQIMGRDLWEKIVKCAHIEEEENLNTTIRNNI